MQKLENVSLVAVATTEVEATVKALEYSQRGIDFEKTLLFANYQPNLEGRKIDYVQIEKFNSVGEWGRFVVFELFKYIATSHIVLIHADGFIVNPESWSNDFLNYDYIGAPWPIPRDSFSYRDFYGNIIRVGNSVSLRSHKLLRMPSDLKLDWQCDHDFFHEDGFLCVQNRHLLQKHGIEYAPLSVARFFSHEKPLPETKGIRPFAFHKWEGPNKKFPRFTTKESKVVKALRKISRLTRSRHGENN